ncbi:MAG: hypothetical protein Q9217_006385 [Psora testacea]
MSESRKGIGNVQGSHRLSSSQAKSPVGQTINPFDMSSIMSGISTASDNTARPDTDASSAIRIRKIAPHTALEKLQDVLEFIVKDFERVDLVASAMVDQGFQTAIARFASPSAAREAQAALDGRQLNPSRPNEPRIIVEIMRLSPESIGSGRNNFDLSTTRAHSGSSTSSASRFNGGYQSMSRISPPNGNINGYVNAGPSGDRPEMTSSTSKYLPSTMDPRQRVLGRDVIGEDGPDDETSDLLRDPVGYATNGMSGLSRRSTSNSQATSQYNNNLPLNTSNPTSPPMPGYTSPRHNGLHSPVSTMTPPNGMSTHIPNASYQMRHPQFPRANMPPVNPADQNPPCNTLYVGNLPIDTSEDELKAMFSKQRGYKRLCFRTKQNGPMCFVEFEDVSFATKALNDLYGYPLHNSAHRGGIRLSFSKNPLGVRNGQPGGMGPPTPLSPSGQFPGMNGLGIQPFSTANGPPPGIPAPPGLPLTSNGGTNGMMSPTGMGLGGMTTGGGSGMMSPTAMSFGVSGLDAAMGAADPMNPYGMGGGWPRQEGYGGYATGR